MYLHINVYYIDIYSLLSLFLLFCVHDFKADHSALDDQILLFPELGNCSSLSWSGTTSKFSPFHVNMYNDIALFLSWGSHF